MAAWQFKHSREHYASLYNISSRTVSRYAKAGIPLDDEPATRAMIAAGAKSPAPLRRNAPRTASDTVAGALGLSGAVLRIAEAEAAAHDDYQTALDGTDGTAVALAEKRWLGLTEALRKNEVSNPEVAEANRNTLPVSEVEAGLNEVFLKLRQDLESMPKRLALELVGKDELGAREVLKREIEEIILALFTCKYLGGQA